LRFEVARLQFDMLRKLYAQQVNAMTDATTSTLVHYGSDDLADRIVCTLAAAGHDTANPTVEMLNLIDQLHGGGINSTAGYFDAACR
jgi:hypothetical protein